MLFLSTLSLRRATQWRRSVKLFRQFLSTLSLRRATFGRITNVSSGLNFYPRSPCGERRWLRCWQLAARDISIHALLAESDGSWPARLASRFNFYPRSPCGERHDTSSLMRCQVKFLSTLSLRRATAVNIQRPTAENNFYPRSPCGERPLR